MTDNDSHEPTDDARIETDGAGVATARDHRDADYLEEEVNLLNPSTPFMRDHLRLIWTSFAVWAVIVFGPVTLTALAPEVMTSRMPVIGFPLHYFLVGIGAPAGALLLSAWYARKRDRLDEKYGIDHAAGTTAGASGGEDAAATDGGVRE